MRETEQGAFRTQESFWVAMEKNSATAVKCNPAKLGVEAYVGDFRTARIRR
jgi:hypothetical protein